MGRKRNQGKARKAAKAKAREEAKEERGNDNNNQRKNERQQSLAAQMQQLELSAAPVSSDTTKCRHGCEHLDNMCIGEKCIDFVVAFREAFHDADRGTDIAVCLAAAHDATITLDKFAEVWNDSAQMNSAISMLLCNGTQHVLDGKYAIARDLATFARYFEQHVAVVLHQTQALMHWPKIYETYLVRTHPSDLHTLVKFFRKRVFCSCLDAKYEEVKATTKMGLCFNLQCNLPRVERSKTMYCDRCRCATYCSRECQKAHWSKHQATCDKAAALKAKFDAKQQNA